MSGSPQWPLQGSDQALEFQGDQNLPSVLQSTPSWSVDVANGLGNAAGVAVSQVPLNGALPGSGPQIRYGSFFTHNLCPPSRSLSLTTRTMQCICLRVKSYAEVWAPGCLRCVRAV